MMSPKFSYVTLEYKRAVPVRGKRLLSNEFLKVELLEKEYFVSVLPGVHESTLAELAYKIKTFFATTTLDFAAIDFDQKFFGLTKLNPFLESIKHEALFNIEAILLGLLHTSHPHLFSHDKILINDLFSREVPIEKYQSSECIKLKIEKNIQATKEDLLRLYQQNPTLKFRLDGNRQFELEEMIAFVHLLKKDLPPKAFAQIDYIEEPFKNFYDTFLFEKRAGVPIAIDESFDQYAFFENISWPVIIKPSLFGISFVSFWLGHHQNQRAIISSCFEHPTIMEGLYFLARKRSMEFHGLSNFLS